MKLYIYYIFPFFYAIPTFDELQPEVPSPLVHFTKEFFHYKADHPVSVLLPTVCLHVLTVEYSVYTVYSICPAEAAGANTSVKITDRWRVIDEVIGQNIQIGLENLAGMCMANDNNVWYNEHIAYPPVCRCPLRRNISGGTT
ncbi:MAG: hypothetical protein HDT16_08355 [Oscillibacter sp.]|nr:hypothetical protein [Oscillibacter sp.]